MYSKRTKVIATIGPSSSSVTVLSRMIRAGMNVARLNFSHGTHQEHKRFIKTIQAASKKVQEPVAILQDLQGPKIRVGHLEEGIPVKKHQVIQFDTSIKEYTGTKIPVTYEFLHKDVKKGHRILLDDGRIETEVVAVRGRTVEVKVTVPGEIRSHKGMNLPDSTVSASAFTKKDHDDLLFGLEQEVDWVALSFVTGPEVIHHVRDIMRAKCRQLGTVMPKIMAKIERPEAVERFEEILEAADGVMMARGDLGVEVPFEKVPIIQKKSIELARKAGKPVVVATQMLDSMTEQPRATRAEVSDVANAVFDHADAVMLSQESAMGSHPNIVVQTMASIAEEVEQSRFDDISFCNIHELSDIATSLAQTLHVMAENKQIDMIVTADSYGDIAQKVNVFRPNVPIVFVCPNATSARQHLVKAGISTIVEKDDPATFIMRIERVLREQKKINSKTRVAYVTKDTKGSVSLTIRTWSAQ